MKIILKDEQVVSLNTFYSGKHWSTRQQEAKRVHALVKYATLTYKRFTKPVAITITAYTKYPIDPDNINGKMYIDGLKERVIPDDNPKWIDSVTFKSRCDRNNVRVEIDILTTDVN